MAKHNTSGFEGRIRFTGSPDDFVEFIRLLEATGGIFNNETGKPATREEIAGVILQHMDADLGGFADYRTLELCSGGSDFGDRIRKLMEQFREGDLSGLPPDMHQ